MKLEFKCKDCSKMHVRDFGYEGEASNVWGEIRRYEDLVSEQCDCKEYKDVLKWTDVKDISHEGWNYIFTVGLENGGTKKSNNKRSLYCR